jgi:hypothetical protein
LFTDGEAAFGAPERFAFRQVQTSRSRLAMTHRPWAKYQCPSHARIFKGTADDPPVPWVEDPWKGTGSCRKIIEVFSKHLENSKL